MSQESSVSDKATDQWGMDDVARLEPPKLSDVTIGVLTALPEEYAACKSVLDPDELGVQQWTRATSGQLSCWLCRVTAKHGGSHAVAITLLGDMGNNAAAISANILLQHCDGIQHLIMCGIAGAVPNPARDKAEHHVRLGDIVVTNGPGIIQYDRGKQRGSHPPVATPNALKPISASSVRNLFAKIFGGLFNIAYLPHPPVASHTQFIDHLEHRPSPRPPSPELLTSVRLIQSEELLLGGESQRPWELKIEQFLTKHLDASHWCRPHHNMDVLNDSPNAEGARTPHPKDPLRRSGCPRIFLGPIGSANVVQANPAIRDSLRDRYGLKAIEMEGSGIADAAWIAGIGYMVIRGTCDYCNATKNDKWHNYAALVAAAFTSTVLEQLPSLSHTQWKVPSLMGSTHVSSKHISTSAIDENADNTEEEAVPQSTSDMPLGGHDEPSSGEGPKQKAERHGKIQLEIADSKPVEVRNTTESAATESSDTQNDIEELIDRCILLSDRGDEPALKGCEAELEKKLRKAPASGAIVKRGWIQLAKLESQRQLKQKQLGKAVDTDRLHRLRQEAENVIE